MMSRLTSARGWLVVGIVGSVVILLLGYFALIAPQRSKASSIGMEAAEARGTTQGLQAKAIALKKQSDELPAKQAELQALSERLPDDAGVAQIIRQITSVAAESGVTLNEFTPSAPQALEVEVPSAASSSEPSASPSATPSPSDNGSSESAPKTKSTVPTSNLSYVTISITAEGQPSQLSAFVNGLEGITRAMLLTGVKIDTSKTTSGSSGTATTAGTLTATIDGRIFMRTDSSSSASPKPSATASN